MEYQINPNQKSKGKCIACGDPLDGFHSCYCKPCRAAYLKARRNMGVDKYYNIKTSQEEGLLFKKKLVDRAGGKCNRCGYTPQETRHYAALHFHHKDRSKAFHLSTGNRTRAWDKVIVEADQCELLCSNCHVIEHCGDVSNKPGRPRKPDSDRVTFFRNQIQAKMDAKGK